MLFSHLPSILDVNLISFPSFFKQIRSVRVSGQFDGTCHTVGYSVYEQELLQGLKQIYTSDTPDFGSIDAAGSFSAYGNANFALYP